jgi:hypothetical protein
MVSMKRSSSPSSLSSLLSSLATMVVVAAISLALGACNKPTEENCRKALANMQRLMGTENLRDPEMLEGEVRRCKGGSKRAAVDCAIKAQSFDELKHCNFYHLPDTVLPNTLRDGSATSPDMGSAGSAAMGSAATGSATSSTGAGSAASSTSGSGAAGSAATGSAAGSAATGSAAGSAATGSSASSAKIDLSTALADKARGGGSLPTATGSGSAAK